MSRLESITSYEQFRHLKYGLDIQSFEDLQGYLERDVSFADPLGSLLELLRFNDSSLRENVIPDVEPWYADRWRLMGYYGITLQSPASLYQGFSTKPESTKPEIAKLGVHTQLGNFVEKWKDKQGENITWNPPYATVVVSGILRTRAKQSSPLQFLQEFDLSWRSLYNHHRGNNFLLYPFTGFDLAYLLEQCYTHKS